MVTEEELSKMSPEEVAELQKKNCIFCKIISGEVPSKKVYEDDHMVGILDIRPATEGHILVMPKEHYAVLPLIPKEVSKHMFEITKELCSSIRKGLPATGTTMFIANGAAAGQQSPHFLYHIVPRNQNDGLDNFDIPEKELSQVEIKEKVQQRFATLMKVYLAQEGKLPPAEAQEAMKEQLALMIERNPELKKLLMENPSGFKEALGKNPQLREAFQGIDIEKLSEQLKEAESKKPAEQSEAAVEKSVENEEQEEINDEEETKTDVENNEDEVNEEDSDADLDKIAELFK